MKPQGDAAHPEGCAPFGDLEGLRRLAARLVRDDADAEDVVQESLLLGWRRATGRILDVGPWLRGVVRNKARELRRTTARREAREAKASPRETPMTPLDIAARVEVHEQLLAAVKALPEPYRDAVWLHHVDGCEVSDIAREKHASVETVRTHIKRGIARLREDLDRRHDGKRGGWVASLAAFAGVKPSIALATGSTAGAAAAPKAIAVVGALTIAVTAVVGLSVWLSIPESSPVMSSHAYGDPGPRERQAGGKAGRDAKHESIVEGAAGSLRPKPFPTEAAEPVNGTFFFHYEQGYSFASQSVTDDIADADLVFKSCAGGVSSVTLEAPGGTIVELRQFQERFPRLADADALRRSVVRAEPAAIGNETTAQADERIPASNAFVVSTRHGQWVALAIVERYSTGNWTKTPIVIHYSLNADEPVFQSGTGDVTIGGIDVDSQLLAKLQPETSNVHQARIQSMKERLEELDRRAAALQPVIQARDGADIRVGAVLDRRFAQAMEIDEAYYAATYDLDKGMRGNPQSAFDDADFELGAQLDVSVAVEDRNVISDLGAVPYGTARSGEFETPFARQRVPPVQGHVYAVQKLRKRNWRRLMRVEELVAGESMIFSWVAMESPSGPSTAPPLEELAPAEDVLQAPLARLQIRGGAGGGNPFRVFLDRTAERIRGLSPSPLDLAKPLDSNEKHRGYVVGGRVPPGMVFQIDSIEYSAKVRGDGNGPGEFVLKVGGIPVAHVREDRRDPLGPGRFLWFSVDRGDQVLEPGVTPIRGRLSVSIPIPRGDETSVYAEIANSSWADVTLTGRLVPSEHAADMRTRNSDPRLLHALEEIAAAPDDSTAAELGRQIESAFVPALRSILESIPAGAWRDRLRSALNQAQR